MLDNLKTIPEVCASEGISKSLLYKLLKQGNGPKFIKIGWLTRFSEEDIKEWRLTLTKRTFNE